ncbi:MAG TPA: leucyl aminopeptidase [Solirubrobacteraceae bacterium]|nr:leucyl aminopeptidase [Solirubrobacteraceae bacterium]
MHAAATTDGPLNCDADTIAVGVFDGERIDLAGGAAQALLERGEARATFKHLAVAHADRARIIVAGLGARSQFDAEQARIVAAAVYERASELGAETLCWALPDGAGDEIAAALAQGTILRAYRFDRYRRSAEEPPRRPGLLLISAPRDLELIVRDAGVIAAAQNRARDLANLPPNELTPTALGAYAQELAKRMPAIHVDVRDGDWIREQGMGAFACVGQGSPEDQRLIELHYDGGAGGQPLALVGKGVTFDSGGLTLKPPASIYVEKFDMSGGAAVIEAIGALAELRVPVSVLGLVGATENVIDGASMRPGDIVRALDGTTIEVNNPDAEGRMVLADCIAYAKRLGCSPIVDIATLTGAKLSALGTVYAGLFGNDEQLVADVLAACGRAGELAWRLPLHPAYARQTEGRYADLTNRPEPRQGLASAAAELLHHFAGDTPWVHLDIAGMAHEMRTEYLVAKGGTGFGVRLLVELAGSYAARA